MRPKYFSSWTLVVVWLTVTHTVNAASDQAHGMKKGSPLSKSKSDRLQANPASVNQVSDSVTNLAQKIARSIANPKSKTEIFSPVSIAGALSLLLLGAVGQTKRELLNVMGFSDGHYAFGRLFQDLMAIEPSLVPLVTWRMNDKCNRYDDEKEGVEFAPTNTTANTSPSHLISVVNGMFLQTGLKPSVNLVEDIKKFYRNNAVQNLDFERDPNGAASYINDWCARETNGKIREMVTAQMVANSRMIVASALYFKAQWETTFSPYGTRPRPFYLNGRQEQPINVETMATTGCFPYYDATAQYGAQIIGLPYETGISTMYIIMPTNSTRQKLQNLQMSFSADNLNWMIDQMKTKKGMVVLPKLSISNRVQLSTVLQQLGVRDLFDPSTSDLSRVLDETDPQSSIKQERPIHQQLGSPYTQPVASRVETPAPTAVDGHSVGLTVRPAMRPPTLHQAAKRRVIRAGVSSAIRNDPVPAKRPPTQQVNNQQKPNINSNIQKNSSSKQPLQTTRPQAPPSNTNVHSVIIPFEAHDCTQVENCWYNKKCICTLQPTTENVADCRAPIVVRRVTNELDLNGCPLSFESKLGWFSLCPKRSYRKETQFQNQDACGKAGCVFFSKRCYCCQVYKQSPNTAPVAQAAQSADLSRIDSAILPWVRVVRYWEYAPNSGYEEICQQVSSLNSEQQCTFYRYNWLPYYSICINERTCRPPQKNKRQAQQYPSVQNRQEPQRPIEQQRSQQQNQQQWSEQLQAKPPAPQYEVQTQQPPQLQSNFPNQQQPPLLPPRQSGTPLFVNEIITQVKLDVNEQGTEGGAVTLALIDRIGPGYTFQADGPFLILIRHDSTKALLFYGAVYDPRP